MTATTINTNMPSAANICCLCLRFQICASNGWFARCASSICFTKQSAQDAFGAFDFTANCVPQLVHARVSTMSLAGDIGGGSVVVFPFEISLNTRGLVS